MVDLNRQWQITTLVAAGDAVVTQRLQVLQHHVRQVLGGNQIGIGEFVANVGGDLGSLVEVDARVLQAAYQDSAQKRYPGLVFGFFYECFSQVPPVKRG